MSCVNETTPPDPSSIGQPVNTDCNAVPNLTFAFGGSTETYKPPTVTLGTLNYSTSECADKEAAYVANLQAEALNTAGGPVNIFPMLGVHNQGSTMAMVSEMGYPISSGTPAGFNALNAFLVSDGSWKSVQRGIDVITTPAYIGYSFGTKKAHDGIQERYQSPEPVRHQVGSLKITQGDLVESRATQVRVEASDDGINWQRIDVLKLPNTSQPVTVGIRSSAMYNQWRLIPTFFNGVAANAQWEVVEIQFLEATTLAIDNIEDFFLLENRDRSYCRTSVMVKCQYDLLDVQTELAKFGINIPQTYIFTCSFAVLVSTLGRPLVVGDILELPGEAQYDTSLRPIRKWLEVTDTSWSTEGYTLNWKPQMYRFYAQPIMPSVEHRDILGLPGKANQAKSDDDFLAGMMLQNNQAYQATEAIKQHSQDVVPQTGADVSNISSGKPLLGPKGGYDGNDLYAADAIPPDGAPYTTGDKLPLPSEIADGHYHRQTYTMVPESIRPQERLLRWNSVRNRWSVIEVNTKTTYESHKRTISKMMGSDLKMNPDYKP